MEDDSRYRALRISGFGIDCRSHEEQERAGPESMGLAETSLAPWLSKRQEEESTDSVRGSLRRHQGLEGVPGEIPLMPAPLCSHSTG